MGRLNSAGVDAQLAAKMQILLQRAFEPPYENKGKGPVMTYEKFVQLLDVDDVVAQKAIDVLVKDVFTRARGRKQAIEDVRRYTLPSYSSVAAAAAAEGSYNEDPARRAWHTPGAQLTTSQRLHGWRAGAIHDRRNDRQQQDTAEYDAIIADAQRQVASPLPIRSTLAQAQAQAQQQHSPPHNYYTDRMLDMSDWPDLNTAAQPVSDYSWPMFSSDSESEPDDDAERVREAERLITSVQHRRERAGLTRTSTSASSASNTSTRRRILERLEMRRRDLMERAEQRRNAGASQSYPNHFNTSFSRTASNNVNANTTSSQQSQQPQPSESASMPIIVGGDFTDLPTSVTRSESDTVRASYAPLHRNNSIRRSGYHAPRGSDQSLSQSVNEPADLARVTQNPLGSSRLQPRWPLSVAEPPEIRIQDSAASATRSESVPSTTAPAASASDNADRTNSFETFSRLSRAATRAMRNLESAREEEEQDDPRRAQSAMQGFMSSPDSDPMLGSTPADGDAITELLGSSSTAAALGSGVTTSSASVLRPNLQALQRWNSDVAPPRAPILSRRSFPLEGNSTANASSSSVANQSSTESSQAPASNSLPSTGLPRSNSLPTRGPLYRREEVFSLAEFLLDDEISEAVRATNE